MRQVILLVMARYPGHRPLMDLDDLLLHYFGTTSLDDLDEETMETGRERVAIAFGTEQERGRRFALWILLEALGSAPEPDAAFEDERDRKAAEDYLWASRRMERR